MSLANALSGIRLVDFTQVASGPTCTLMLADLGADVIKIEPPSGDTARSFGPPWIDGVGATFLALNRNKRGVVLDLKNPRDVVRAQELIRNADVVVENFRPGVMARLGLGCEAMQRDNPRLVYCSISAYGQNGSWRERAGVDGVVQAITGLMSLAGEADSGPIKVQAPIVDVVTGFLAAAAVQAALHDRARTGRGQWVDVSMLASSLMLQQTALASYLLSGDLPVKCGSAAPYAAPNESFATRDGSIMIAAYQPDRWRKLCEVLGVPALADDPRFARLPDRIANRTALVAALEAVLRTRDTNEWIAMLEAADVLCAPIATYDAVVELPPVQENGLLVDVPHPTRGSIRTVGCGLAGDATGSSVRYAAPRLGEHNDEIFAAEVPQQEAA
jgi:crotonobetainyl-CoA:carnitine CoA-transferase CaiB-like acyl-CoA transferase